MTRIILRITLRPTIWLLPHFWRNRYRYAIRHTHPPRAEYAWGHRLCWLCLDCEFAVIPRGAHWNPDGTHLYQPAD
jgi:hypothetical protein